MRFGRQKRHRKIVRFYKACFGFREPFKVLCDGTFVHHLIQNNIMPADTALSDLLGAPVKLFTSRCVLTELKRLGQSHSESFEAASSLFIARCDHEKRKTAEDCILEIIGNDNHDHFFVATQDSNMREKFREVPGVPAIYGLRNALYLSKLSEIQINFAKSTEEERSRISQPEYLMLKASKKGTLASEKPVDLPDGDGNDGDQIFGMNMAKASSGRKRTGVTGGVQFKRKKAKGPNPLSCKKKRDQLHGKIGSKKESAIGSATITGQAPRSRKRKRSQKSQTQP